MIARRNHQGMLDPEMMQGIFNQIPRTSTFLLDSTTPPDTTQWKQWKPGISCYHSFKMDLLGDKIGVFCWETVPQVDGVIQEPTHNYLTKIQQVTQLSTCPRVNFPPRSRLVEEMSEFEEEIDTQEFLLDDNECDDQDQISDIDYDEEHPFHDIDDSDPDSFGFLNLQRNKWQKSRSKFQFNDIIISIPKMHRKSDVNNFLEAYLKDDKVRSEIVKSFGQWQKGEISSEYFDHFLTNVITADSVRW